MIYSMTGFAHMIVPLPGGTEVSIQIRSLNHRFMDLQVSLPERFMRLEPDIRRIIISQVSRGKVSLSVRENGSRDLTGGVLNKPLLLRVAQEWREVFPDSPVPESMLLIPGIVDTSELDLTEEDRLELYKGIECVRDEMIRVKSEEGSRLLPELDSHLREVARVLDELETDDETITEELYRQIRTRMSEIAAESLDEERIATEAGILAMRMDIREELVRARRFVDAMLSLMNESEGPSGKELNFYCQELQRELNTMGQKMKDLSQKELVLKARLETEKFREQVQNVE